MTPQVMPQAELTIRPARADAAEAEAIAALHRRAVHGHYEGRYPTRTLEAWSAPIDARRIRQVQESGADEWRLLAEREGVLVGFGALVIAHEPEGAKGAEGAEETGSAAAAEGPRGEIRACYVPPEAAGTGVGSALVAALEAEARRQGLAALDLVSFPDAVAFYEACGYASTGSLVKTFGRPEEDIEAHVTCIRMRKVLG